jgi:hypothetical protein
MASAATPTQQSLSLPERNTPYVKLTSPTRGASHQHAAPYTNTRRQSPTRGTRHQHAAPYTNTRHQSPTRGTRHQHAAPVTNTRPQSPTRHAAPDTNTPHQTPTRRTSHQHTYAKFTTIKFVYSLFYASAQLQRSLRNNRAIVRMDSTPAADAAVSTSIPVRNVIPPLQSEA